MKISAHLSSSPIPSAKDSGLTGRAPVWLLIFIYFVLLFQMVVAERLKSELLPAGPSATAEWKEGSSGRGPGTRKQSNPNQAAQVAGTAQTGHRARAMDSGWGRGGERVPPWPAPRLEFSSCLDSGRAIAWHGRRTGTGEQTPAGSQQTHHQAADLGQATTPPLLPAPSSVKQGWDTG